MEMRKCKECGKLFQPKGREQYCSDVHYRPCPICGKPVVAKYLSDPARRCDDCKKIKSAASPSFKDLKKAVDGSSTTVEPNMKSAEVVKDNEVFVANTRVTPKDIQRIIDMGYPVINATTEDIIGYEHRWIYVGVPTKGSFVPGHEYSIKLTKDIYGYIIQSDEDLTANQSINIYDRFSSIISLNHNFRRSTPVA